ncbi:adenylate/guanylate cyclase domain-containing protein [Microbaculum marinum]|uniref:Adenylate/guanylate cyclase domain-containing protein n=1 Tax=Microbaculum marinum TaxID=1764581 RepID=A0AAW9RVY4_9HYPH
MTDTTTPTFGSILAAFRRVEERSENAQPDRFAAEALERNKREGLILAVKARWIALAAIAILIAVLNRTWDQLYYEALLVGFALIGWAQLRVGRVGKSRVELLLMFCDLALMTFTLVVPNPFSPDTGPLAMQYRYAGFVFFFVLLAGGTLSYSWRTIVAMGTWTASLWLCALAVVMLLPTRYPELSVQFRDLFAGWPDILQHLDPNSFEAPHRIQEAIVFFIVACILALGVRRSNYLVMQQAALERERANLARYFSPNVVEQLAHNDQPLKEVRAQKVAVLFVDIVGFSAFADTRDPVAIIATLRDFHALMESEVFRHNGTLDKYLGDGLMATFGTPIAGDTDAGNALRCARAMLRSATEWNEARVARGEAPVPVSFGLHYGDAVLGDIGATRLEFAVIGTTVNVASRLEAMTRSLGAPIVVSDDLLCRAREEASCPDGEFDGFEKKPAQAVRGLAQPLDVWMLVPDMPTMGTA